jgi:5-methylcytosine-specific restriction endonuclease McrA
MFGDMKVINMAREFARKFYGSRAWKECRASYILSVNGLCERCLANGKYVAGEEVHHKIYLTLDNINDPYITLNWDNLELLCQSCHSKEHMSKHSPLRDDVMFDENGNLVRRE